MKHNETEKLFSLPFETIIGSPDDKSTCISRFTDSGVYFREFSLDSQKGGEPVEILQITDIHFNAFTEEDLEDEELALTKQFRLWNAGGDSVRSVKKTIPLAKYFDKTIITGDTLDFLSQGAMDMLHEHIWGVDPDILVALGGHELVKQMQTGKADKTPLEDRLAYLQKNWRHDIHYHSEVIGDKVLAVVLDNSQSKFLDCQYEKLKADIERARAEGLVMLIFEHEPLSTGKPEDEKKPALKRYDPEFINYYSGNLIGSTLRGSEPLYELIVHSADVIGGIFCGHEHSAFYTEINAFTPSGDEKAIPQIILEGSPYDNQSGHILRITVY